MNYWSLSSVGISISAFLICPTLFLVCTSLTLLGISTISQERV